MTQQLGTDEVLVVDGRASVVVGFLRALTVGAVRGLLGLAAPSLNRPMPSTN